MKPAWIWNLRSHLSALLVVNIMLTVVLVSVAVMVWRLPEIEGETQQALDRDIEDVSARLELLLGAWQSRMEVVAGLVHGQPAQQVGAALDLSVFNTKAFQALYLVSPSGEVEAAGMGFALRAQADDLVGSDLSTNALYQAVQSSRRWAWSGKHLSGLTGAVTVALAYRDDDGRVLMGEMPLDYLLEVLQMVTGRGGSAIWVVDRTGEVIADTDGGRYVGTLNIRNWPMLQAPATGAQTPQQFSFEGQRFHAAVARSDVLDWYFVGRAPAGWGNPDVRRAVMYVGVMVLSCLAVGLLIAPLWAQRLTRPLQDIVARTALTTAGKDSARAWPRGAVAEFNALAADLETMATALQDREQKFLAIFNASPVPMAVVDVDQGHRLLDVNLAWCREFMRERASVLGRTELEIGLLLPAQLDRVFAQMQQNPHGVEASLVRGDGEQILGQVFNREVTLPSGRLMIWATVDVGPLRRIKQELHELNQQLEARVARRSEDLAASNAALSETVAELRNTQAELVRAEKMAALGQLVAGVAHELNTPLGNGVMAIDALADAALRFKRATAGGLKQADLNSLVDSVEQGTDIAGRNLRRAADLVQNFKQVAVDQTSAQRRSFELGEVVHEMVASLRPSFRRTSYCIEVDVPATGLLLDSYPGALGQVIGNLVQNAVLHGFDGRSHGTVRLSAERARDGRIVLRVTDDGRGMSAALVEHVFEPFVTSNVARSGVGLGLHISYNAVVDLLGGTLTVQSTEGAGSCFEMRLPPEAPPGPRDGSGSDARAQNGPVQ